MKSIELYNYFRSSTSYRARIALHLKNLPFTYRAVNLLKDGQFEESFRRLNPQSEVPTLVHDGHVISQSLPILEYLDEVFPEIPLYPGSPAERARIRQFCENINSYLHPLSNLKVTKYLASKYGLDPAAREAWVHHWYAPGLEVLEVMLKANAGKYCFGDRVTAADVCLVPMLASARRVNVPTAAFPIMERIDRDCLELQAFKLAHPFAQPDTPEEFRQT